MKDKTKGKILNLKISWWEALEKLSKEKSTNVTIEIREAIRKHLK
jgi:hypothetical protein